MNLKSCLLIIITSLLFVSCSNESLTHGNKEKFESLLMIASTPQTIHWADYLGETENKIYIEYNTLILSGCWFTPNGPKTIVYWFKKRAIPDQLVTKFKSLKTPHKYNFKK